MKRPPCPVSMLLRGWLLVLCACALCVRLGYAQNPNDGFDPDADADVAAMAVQPDGKILIGGDFANVGGNPHARLARLLPDGSADPLFNGPVIDATVLAIAVQADGRIVIGGGFQQVGAYGRNFIARLNADGSVDATFDPNADKPVFALAVQPDGKILVGGNFTTLNNGAVARSNIARLDSDGSVDATFDPHANGIVHAFVIQADRRIVVGGEFTTLNAGATTRHHIARLGSDGSVDATYDPDANSIVQTAALQPDGRIVIGGYFTKLKANSIARNYIARLNTDGSVDAGFDPHADNWVFALAMQADAKILLGGYFTTLQAGAVTRHRVARVNTDGGVDASFDPDADAEVLALAVQSDGKALLGGNFVSLNGGATTRNHVARMNLDSSVDATLLLNADNYAHSIAVDPDGQVLIGGDFTTLDGGATTKKYLARLRADGSVDASFNPDPDAPPYTMAIQPDRKILLGGNFTTFNGGATSRNRIARLNPDGSVDSTFDPDPDASVNAIVVQPDGKIVIAGTFSTLKGGTIARQRLARLNADGSVDSTVFPILTSTVVSLALQPDGKILASGYFTITNGATMMKNLVRLNAADGSIDASYNPDPDYSVYAMGLQPDGRLVIAGTFTALNGGLFARHRIARLNADGSVDSAFDPDANVDIYDLALQADGKILIGGFFSTLDGGAATRHYVARLNANGSVDDTFDPEPNDAVYAIAVQPDGKVLLSGSFSTLNGGATARHSIARLSSPEPALQSLDLNGAGLTWTRSGAASELALPPMVEFSIGGTAWASAGTMTPIAGGWRLSGISQPIGEPFFLRAHGSTSGGYGTASTGMAETLRQYFGNDSIFADGFQ